MDGLDRDPSADDGRIGGLAGFRRVAVRSGFSLASSGDCAPREARIPTARFRRDRSPLHQHHQHPRRGFNRHQPRPAQRLGVGHGGFRWGRTFRPLFNHPGASGAIGSSKFRVRSGIARTHAHQFPNSNRAALAFSQPHQT